VTFLRAIAIIPPITVAIPAARLKRNGSNKEAILLTHPSTRANSVDRVQTQFKRSPSVEARAYTQLIDLKDDEYTVKVAASEKEACQLTEAGFEYVCEHNGNKIFRKRR
jgi:hypothetical protein